MIGVEVIADSKSEDNVRLTTLKLRYPRFIHAEFMTHRVFSRNASSSRAIPTKKLIEEASDPGLRAVPLFWGKNQPGMQADEELAGNELLSVQRQWEIAAELMADRAESLLLMGAHKQIANRILEPFTHINVVVTSTKWANFFALRLHPDAQPEMRALAQAMLNALKASTPKVLKQDEWHLPFIREEDHEAIEGHLLQEFGFLRSSDSERLDLARKVSVARCARVSYRSFETQRDSTIGEDLELYDRLLAQQPIHASPAEHQATPDRLLSMGGWVFPHLHGNLEGWLQYRKMLPNEVADTPVWTDD